MIACDEGGINPSEIDYIKAHGTSTPINDKYETNTIKLALKDSANDVLISSTKSINATICIKKFEE